MLRRHLRLPSSSEDDEDAPPPQTLITPNPNTLLEISDDDFLDVPDDLSPPVVEAPPGRAGDSADAPGGMEEERDGFTREIDDFLRSLGLRLRPEWLESCAATLMASGSDFSRLDVAGRAKRCFEQFLISDMNTSGAGVLPEYVHRLHKTELEGPFALQIDEIVNISAPIRERYHEVPVGYKRCLKLSMTDGVQRVFGMEYRPIKELEVLASSGLKVVVHNVHIRRGLLMLVPEIFTVLGGLVEDLDAARKRLVAEVNKPPRGKRKRGNISPLSTRACLAAWPSNNVLDGVARDDAVIYACVGTSQNCHAVRLVHEEMSVRKGQCMRKAVGERISHEHGVVGVMNSLISEGIELHIITMAAIWYLQLGSLDAMTKLLLCDPVVMVSSRGNNLDLDASNEDLVPVEEGPSSGAPHDDLELPSYDDDEVEEVCKSSEIWWYSSSGTGLSCLELIFRCSGNIIREGNPSNSGRGRGNRYLFVEVIKSTKIADREEAIWAVDSCHFAAGTNLVSAGIVTARTTIPEFVELGTTIQDDPCIVRHSNEVVAAQSARIPLREEYSAHIEENITEGPACHGNRSDMLSNSTHNPLSTMEHAHSSDVEDAVEIEHPLILSDLDSIPFTYLACLFAKWTTEKDKIPPIHGRIKCFLTGVKGFQFKERRTYELSVYVDDGSLISEVLIDHKVVQNGIGHSPEEVTAALSSTEKRIVADMRETMKKFQLFLAKFEVHNGGASVDGSSGYYFIASMTMNTAMRCYHRLSAYNACDLRGGWYRR
ncbi:hypothetical protein ZIOFF_009572 [Zingiber officinale]|uniref:RecQ-mediated genome instability protein 1 n=1 Tax=Zingiber officinale TaxID=94328 RepID=A0A8J5I3U8_ZINOF|nr:hypothetical protein ZIOFF_009572 [Zingiber officinale]